MATFASLDADNKVTNTLVADTLEIAQMATGAVCIEYTDENLAGIGWSYDGAKFIAPTPEEI